MEYIQVAVGLVLLVLAGDALVRGAAALALKVNLSPMIIGATVVAVGTSAPELVVSVNAVLSGAPQIALGNVVGSNIANILLVLGLPAIIMPICCAAPGTARLSAVLVGVTLLTLGLAMLGGFDWRTSAPLLALLAWFLWDSVRVQPAQTHGAGVGEPAQDRAVAVQDDEFDYDAAAHLDLWKCWALLVGGLVGIIFGAQWLIDGAVVIASALGVSKAVIGLTLVALGTSLPELATALIAAFRKQADVAIGNALGSNVFNLAAILGFSGLVGRIPVTQTFWQLDFWVMLAAAVLAMALCIFKVTIGRISGAVLVACYAGYIWLTMQTGAVAAVGIPA